MNDFIVVGSGPSGAMAAQTLIEGGASVLMLDVGAQDPNLYGDMVPDTDYVDIRESDPNQHEYFLGRNFEGIPWGAISVGAQLTPARRHVMNHVDEWLPLISDNFRPMESLAYGGLGSAWAMGCYMFSRPEAERAGLPYDLLHDAYQTVSDRIGIAAEENDVSKYCIEGLANLQPALEIDNSAETLFRRYRRKQRRLNHEGFFVGRPGLSILTQDKGDRRGETYNDMDLWTDRDKSGYRPWMTIDELKHLERFNYVSGCLVLKFSENEEKVDVHVRRIDTGEDATFTARKLVLATGALGSARIVLRSFDAYETQIPLLCNPFCYIPCLQLGMIGTMLDRQKMSFVQLSMFHDRNHTHTDVAMASLFSYRSLLLFKLIKEAPLNYVDARIMLQYLQSAFTVAAIHLPDAVADGKYMKLVKDPASRTGDKLYVDYRLSAAEATEVRQREGKFKWALRTMGVYPIKTVKPGFGASIHYAGTLPFDQSNEPLRICRKSSRLQPTRNVYIADASGFQFLPAKGLTFSLMAYAHIVAQRALKND
jgi:hypothetical protein